MKRILMIAAVGMAFASPAWAADWVNNSNPLLGVYVETQYVAVDGNGSPITDNTQINADGSFKATCVDCKWVVGTPVAGQEKYRTPVVGAANIATGNASALGADGLAVANSKTGNATVVTSSGVATTGAVVGNVGAFNTLATKDSYGNIYGNVGDSLSYHQSQLNAHSALLSEHATLLDEHGKGLAIAMALPDAWLGDKKRFGIFGSVGGFGDETALGFAAIGRLDDVWSINGKLGADTGFDQFGWQVGFGAQW